MDATKEDGEARVVSLVQRKKTKKQRVEPAVVAAVVAAEPEPSAFTEAMRLHEMAQAWGLEEEDSGDEGNQAEEDQEVLNGTGLGAAAPAPSAAAAAKQGSLEERLERARLRAIKSRETRSVELADWAPALDEDEEENEGARKSRSKKPTGAMQRVKRAFD